MVAEAARLGRAETPPTPTRVEAGGGIRGCFSRTEEDRSLGRSGRGGLAVDVGSRAGPPFMNFDDVTARRVVDGGGG